MIETTLSSKGKTKKKLLLEVSFRLFVKRGLNDVSLEDILVESGIKKGSFYHYFDSKDQLILEAFTECYQQPLSEWFESITKKNLGGREAIEYYFFNTAPHMLNIWRTIMNDTNLRAQDVFLVTMEGIRKIGYIADHYQEYTDRMQTWIRNLLILEQENSKLSSKVNCQSLATFIFSSCEGVYYTWIMNSNIDFHDLMKNTFEYIWGFIEKD
ncbi:MAG: helix-turn-helix transcriptional regulator [Anaerolineae bacterium]|jgi:AcrR family transcriptional regulator|nr:helix-turn-helix transcriptional regulator [Anaerolineae bacterium]